MVMRPALDDSTRKDAILMKRICGLSFFCGLILSCIYQNDLCERHAQVEIWVKINSLAEEVLDWIG